MRREERDLAFTAAEGIDPEVRRSSGPALLPGQEDLDLIGDGVDVTKPGPVLGSWKLHIRRVRNLFGQITTVSDVDPRVASAMQDQGRHVDRRKQVAYVQTHVHADHVLGHRRAGGHAQVARPPRAMVFVVEGAGLTAVPPVARGPRPLHTVDGVLELLRGWTKRIVGAGE